MTRIDLLSRWRGRISSHSVAPFMRACQLLRAIAAYWFLLPSARLFYDICTVIGYITRGTHRMSERRRHANRAPIEQHETVIISMMPPSATGATCCFRVDRRRKKNETREP